jgi:hypothetical protein
MGKEKGLKPEPHYFRFLAPKSHEDYSAPQHLYKLYRTTKLQYTVVLIIRAFFLL